MSSWSVQLTDGLRTTTVRQRILSRPQTQTDVIILRTEYPGNGQFERPIMATPRATPHHRLYKKDPCFDYYTYYLSPHYLTVNAQCSSRPLLLTGVLTSRVPRPICMFIDAYSMTSRHTEYCKHLTYFCLCMRLSANVHQR